MKFLFDQNISHRILKSLPKSLQASSTIKKEKLLNATDRAIWEFPRKNDYTIVTQDADFNDLNILHGFPPKIIWIRAGNLSTGAIATILLDHLDLLEQFHNDAKLGCFGILAMRK